MPRTVRVPPGRDGRVMSEYLRATGTFDEACQRWWRAATPRGSTAGEPTPKEAQLLAMSARLGEARETLLTELGIDSGREGLENDIPPLLPQKLSAEDFAGTMSAELEQRVYQSLSPKVVPTAAVQPAFWMALSLWWWEKGYIPSDWITATAGNNMDNDDRLTRFVGWRLGGLYHVQGSVSVFTCPIARAWWRPLIADRATRGSGGVLTYDRAHEVLRDPAVWKGVTMVLVKRLAALNSPRALAAALLSFENQPPSASISGDRQYNVDQRMGWLGRLAPVVDFSTYSMNDLIKMCSTGSL